MLGIKIKQDSETASKGGAGGFGVDAILDDVVKNTFLMRPHMCSNSVKGGSESPGSPEVENSKQGCVCVWGEENGKCT